MKLSDYLDTLAEIDALEVKLQLAGLRPHLVKDFQDLERLHADANDYERMEEAK